MKNIFLIGSLFCLLVTSCMNINEKVFIKKDGSGTHQIDLDMTQLIEMSEAMGSADSIRDAFTEQSNEPSEYAGMPGISNTQNSFNRSTNTFKSFLEFNNIASLNNALNNGSDLVSGMTGGDESGVGKENTDFKTFSGSGKKYSVNLDFSKLRSSLKDMSEEDLSMYKMFLAESNYTLELSFEQIVKSFSGPNLTKGADDKSVKFSVSIVDMFFDKKLEEVKLSFKLK